MKTFSSQNSQTITCLFQIPYQSKRTALCLLARLIHITTKMSQGLACEPRAAPLWAVRFPPLFVLACAAASTFHAYEITPASTRKDAHSMRGAPRVW
jgi:hypothetical protein